MADALEPVVPRKQPDESRREFFQKALALASALAAAEPSLAQQQPAPNCPAQPGVNSAPQFGAPLPAIGEIARSSDGVLRATVTIGDEDKWVWMASANKNIKQGDPGFNQNETPNQYALPFCPNSAQRMRFFAGAPTGGG
jgi:hypothetical protein